MEPIIVKDWDSLPPEVVGEGILYSTRILCRQHHEMKARIAELEAQLKTAKRDALQKLADGLEITPTKEGPFIWGHLHSQIMYEIEALNSIGGDDEL